MPPQKWCADVIRCVAGGAAPLLRPQDITICVASVVPGQTPQACAPTGLRAAPTASGQAVTVTTSTFKQFYTGYLTQRLGFSGLPVQASSTMRIP
jgi:hypothetical protein